MSISPVENPWETTEVVSVNRMVVEDPSVDQVVNQARFLSET